jgi:hypothetical protein
MAGLLVTDWNPGAVIDSLAPVSRDPMLAAIGTCFPMTRNPVGVRGWRAPYIISTSRTGGQ